MQDYKATQKVAVEKEAMFLPRQPAAAKPSAAAAALAGPSKTDADIETQALLQEQQQVETRAWDNAISYNEAIIEERDHSIVGEWKVLCGSHSSSTREYQGYTSAVWMGLSQRAQQPCLLSRQLAVLCM